MPNPIPTTRQDFGFHQTSANSPGKIGGWVQRSVTPAYYAKVIPSKTLNDKLSASGKLSVTKNSGCSGVLFGWFNDKSRGWRTPNSIAFRLDGNGHNYWLLFEYGTSHWRTGGGATFEGRYQTTKTKPFAADGTTHEWTMSYDPEGNDGNGLITFSLDGNNYAAPLASGHKADGAEFNRFGIFNQQTTGGAMEIYFSDLKLDGHAEDLSRDPKWEGLGNRVEFADRTIRPMHDFGYNPMNQLAGKKGAVGGIIWRDERPAFYAAKVGPLTLRDELFASGKLVFTGAGSDSGVYLGWFDSSSKTNKTKPDYHEPPKNILGISIGGPSRIGHYFVPGYRNSAGEGRFAESGPVIYPDGRLHEWSLHYIPAKAGEAGKISLKLDDHEQNIEVKSADEKRGATFDRFGIFNVQSGGHFVEIYLDDLTYTAGPAKR
ncbi:MAG: hypothetical protein JWQ71_74 [Pedosphaera sp.]|nr:hypothetical protein [Pedosphaera sp.]